MVLLIESPSAIEFAHYSSITGSKSLGFIGQSNYSKAQELITHSLLISAHCLIKTVLVAWGLSEGSTPAL